MNHTLLLFSILFGLFILSCSPDPRYEYSQVIVNNSDYSVKARLIDYDQFALQDSFDIGPNQEVIIHEAPLKDLVCVSVGDIEFTVSGDSLEFTKEAQNFDNWVENNDGSTDEVKIKKCLFIFDNSDIE